MGTGVKERNPRKARPPGLRAARGIAALQGGPSGWRMTGENIEHIDIGRIAGAW
jgi:hypothetical protein